MSPTQVHIRWMIRKDLPEVLAIERAGFADPWLEEDFLRALRQRNCIGLVADYGVRNSIGLIDDADARIAGFVIYELHKTELRVLDLAVHPEFRRQGVGRQLVAKLVGKLASQRRTRITLRVQELALEAQLFFRQQRFLAVGVTRAPYAGSDQDGYEFEYALEEVAVAAV